MRAFSLLELLFALAIFGVVILGFLGVLRVQNEKLKMPYEIENLSKISLCGVLPHCVLNFNASQTPLFGEIKLNTTQTP